MAGSSERPGVLEYLMPHQQNARQQAPESVVSADLKLAVADEIANVGDLCSRQITRLETADKDLPSSTLEAQACRYSPSTLNTDASLAFSRQEKREKCFLQGFWTESDLVCHLIIVSLILGRVIRLDVDVHEFSASRPFIYFLEDFGILLLLHCQFPK